MSLVVCSECGREISSYAAFCPGCGFPSKLQLNTIFEQLSHDGEREVRWAVARNPNCPINLLEQLSHDSEEEVRGAVAGNPNCPISLFTLEELNLETRVLIDKINSLIEEYGENSFCLLKMTEVIDRPYYIDCEYQDLESLKGSSITEIPSCLIRLKYAKKNVEYQQMMYGGAFLKMVIEKSQNQTLFY